MLGALLIRVFEKFEFADFDIDANLEIEPKEASELASKTGFSLVPPLS